MEQLYNPLYVVIIRSSVFSKSNAITEILRAIERLWLIDLGKVRYKTVGDEIRVRHGVKARFKTLTGFKGTVYVRDQHRVASQLASERKPRLMTAVKLQI